MDKKPVIEIVTDSIIEQLEKGVVPWERPWVGGMPPTRVSCMKPYRGLNSIILSMTAIDKEYPTNYWGSYKQWQQKKCPVRKGEKSTIVVFWKFFNTEVKVDERTGEEKVIDRPPLCRYYRVFNYAQTEMTLDDLEPQEAPDVVQVQQQAQDIIDNMPNPPAMKHVGSRAFYKPSADSVTLPPMKNFKSTEGYYSTAYHELAHATGHPTRCARFTPGVDVGMFGSKTYSKEELVAEITAATLCNMAGLDPAILKNQAAYIASWLSVLKDDRQFLVSAASQAQKAVEYMTKGMKENDEKNEPTQS
jgi:antirestriction protein ArdC